MSDKINLVSIQIKTSNKPRDNLKKLIELCNQVPKHSIIVAPEVAITGFFYEDMHNASKFSEMAINSILEISKDKTICLTFITKKNNLFYNTLYIFSNQKIIYTRSKCRLFKVENNYFEEADEKFDIVSIVINSKIIKIATLICFELRFVEYWRELSGADIILVPSYWGKVREKQFQTLLQALAITNQCFVLSSNNANESRCGGIIFPRGEGYFNKATNLISKNVNISLVEQARKSIPLKSKK